MFGIKKRSTKTTILTVFIFTIFVIGGISTLYYNYNSASIARVKRLEVLQEELRIYTKLQSLHKELYQSRLAIAHHMNEDQALIAEFEADYSGYYQLISQLKAMASQDSLDDLNRLIALSQAVRRQDLEVVASYLPPTVVANFRNLANIQSVVTNNNPSDAKSITGVAQAADEPDQLSHVGSQEVASVEFIELDEFLDRLYQRQQVDFSSSLFEIDASSIRLQLLSILPPVFLILVLLISYARVKSSYLTPIETLTSTAKEFGQGNYRARAEINVDNELDGLAASFNHMASQVSSSRAHLIDEVEEQTNKYKTAINSLEERVAERTKELEASKSSLESKIAERTQDLERQIKKLKQFNKVAVGRELKMVELKKEIKELRKKLDNSKKEFNG